MAAHAYCEPEDVYRESGLGALAFLTRPRPLDARAGDALDHTTGTFTLIGHGYTSADRVRLVQVAAGSLPGGATSAAVYVLPVDYFSFQVSATQGGSALTFSSAGSGWGVQVDPEPRLRRLARSCSATIDQHLTAHATPLERDEDGNYPAVVNGICGRMVARRYLPSMMSENPGARAAFDALLRSAALDGDTDKPAEEGTLLGDWKRGQPIYPTPTDQTDGPDDAAYGNGRAPIDWLRCGVM